jgi:hypothetical protein
VFDNYSHRQIAAALHVREGTSKSHLARARKKLQHILFQKIMSDKQERKIRVALWLPFTAKADYIDKLFKTRLKGLTFHPAKDPLQVFSRANWKLQSYTAIVKKQVFFSAFQTAKFIVLPSLAVVTTVYSVNRFVKDDARTVPVENKINFHQNQPTDLKDSVNIADTVKTDNIIPVMDTFGSYNSLRPARPDTVNKKPVIVKRTIIQRQTVTVKKTIQVYDSTKSK